MRLRWRRPWSVILFAVGLALALPACGGGDDDDGGAPTDGQVLRLVISDEPPSFDPGLATDTVSANLLLNLMDPLVRLNDDLEPVPGLAESWKVSNGGTTVTFTLQPDGKWTNGDRVTAADFEYSWKRTLSPELGADYAYQFFGIVGAADYNACKKNCDAMRDKVGVKALDDRRLEVKLTSAQPWFLAQMAHISFMAVHRATVEQFGDKWTEPENIVTNGPFRLTAWAHSESLTLEKWPEWRDAASVRLERIDARIINAHTTALQAFEAGEVDACLEDACLPAQEVERLKGTEDYVKGPALATEYFGFNVKNVPDVNQRRAMAFAIDRTSLVENVLKADDTPATSFSPKGIPGFDVIGQDFLTVTADIDRAKEFMAKATNPKRSINLYYPNALAGGKELAVATQAMWGELGIETTIRGMEWAQFLEFIGPPPNDSVDVHLVSWVGDYVDDINFLELGTCESGNNSTNFCDPNYDKLLEQARKTQDDAARFKLYAQAEDILTGPSGEFPYVPIYWDAIPTLRKTYVKNWGANLLDQYDFRPVFIEES
jgi:oligopeptide transport system substrate-binding protein